MCHPRLFRSTTFTVLLPSAETNMALARDPPKMIDAAVHPGEAIVVSRRKKKKKSAGHRYAHASEKARELHSNWASFRAGSGFERFCCWLRTGWNKSPTLFESVQHIADGEFFRIQTSAELQPRYRGGQPARPGERADLWGGDCLGARDLQ